MRRMVMMAVVVVVALVVAGRAQAPERFAVYLAPDGGQVSIAATDGLLVVNLQRHGSQAVMSVGVDGGSVWVSDAAGHVAGLTPRGVVVAGVGK